jgi:hypothetical protein
VTMLDLWGTLQAKVIRLEVAVVLLACATAGLMGLTLWQATRPVPIYYIPASVGPGLLTPGDIPDALAAEFAQQVVLVLYNITPATAEAAHEAVARYFHPRLLLAFEVQAERERQAIRDEAISSQLSIRASAVHREGEQRRVTVSALRRVYVGKLAVRDEEVEAEVALLPVRPSVLNPYGLIVGELRVTPSLTPQATARRAS